MAKRKKFTIRAEPTKPVRQEKIREVLRVEDGDSLQSIVEWAKSFKVSLDAVTLDCDYDYDYTSYFFILNRAETDPEFRERMDEYERKLAAYKQWRASHEEEIQQELRLRAQEAEEKNRKDQARLEKQIQQEIKRHQKALAALQKAAKA